MYTPQLVSFCDFTPRHPIFLHTSLFDECEVLSGGEERARCYNIIWIAIAHQQCELSVSSGSIISKYIIDDWLWHLSAAILKCMLQLQIFTIERQWTRDARIMHDFQDAWLMKVIRLHSSGVRVMIIYNGDDFVIACASRLLVYVCGNDKNCMRIVDIKLII